MPINKDMTNHPHLIDFHTGEEAKTEFKNSFDAVNVKILNIPSIEDLKKYVPEFCSGTWETRPKTIFSDKEREDVLKDLFSGYLLPTAYESIKITYLIDGIDLSSVAHLIRHRLQGYSAKGTGDVDGRHESFLLHPSIIGSKYEDRLKKIVENSKQLYGEMLDDPTISILAPRSILPRGTENYYYVTSDLKTIIAFVKQRKDESIEQEEMNIFALKLWLEICKIYPMLKSMINFNEPDHFAIKTSIGNRSSNFYYPEEKNDIYDFKESWFCRGKRSSMRNGNQYIKIKDAILNELSNL